MPIPSIRITARLLFLLALTFFTRPLFADSQNYLDALTQNNSDRSAGSDAAQHNADYLMEQLPRLTHANTFRQSFLLTVPIVESCAAYNLSSLLNAQVLLEPPTLEPIPIVPLLPSGGQAAALPPNRITTSLFYAGSGSLEELKGHLIAHQFIALDISSEPTAWQRIASLGPAAIIFLGNPRTPNTDFLNKTVSIPIGTPRFYCDDPNTTARIRSGKIRALSISVRITWQERRLENVLCLIPGRQTTPALATPKDKTGSLWTDQLVVVQTRYDASSQVLTRAPGATQALNTSILLDLAQQIAAAPDHCSVLLVFTAGDQWNFRGTRAFLDLINRELKDPQSAIDDLHKQVAAAESHRAASANVVGGLRAILDNRLAIFSDLPTRTAVEDQLLRSISRVEERLQRARLAASPEVPDLEAQKKSFRTASAALDPHAVRSPAQIETIQSAAGEILPEWQTDFARQSQLLDALTSWPALRHDIGLRFPMLFLSLNLTPNSPRFGLFSRSHYSILDASGQMASFAQAFRRYAAASPAFNPDSMENRFTLETFFPNPVAFPSDAALLRGQSAAAFATIQDPAPLLDTPSDTLENLSLTNIPAIEESLSALLLGNSTLPGALTDPLFYGRTDLPNQTADQPVTLFERALGESLPRLHAARTLIGAECQKDNRPLGPPIPGLIRSDWYLTDVTGSVTFQSALRIPDTLTRMQAFTFDDAGLPIRTLVANQSDIRALAAGFFPNPSQPLRSMLFDCTRLDAFGLFDPRYLETLDNLDVLDARRIDKAQFTNIYTNQQFTEESSGGYAAVFMPPDIRWQLLVAKGNVANRMVLINADADHPLGQGFDTTDLAAIGPLPYRNARDLFALNSKRKNDLERFGISNEVIKQLHAAAIPQLDSAIAAEKSRDYPTLFASSDAAWSLESQVYANLINTSNAIIRGVIFLLLGIIPFSYFLERLLIGATNIYKQIAWFAAIFAFMTFLLWGHPAFRISSAPLMILLAFLILILSTTVVYILYGKFEEEIDHLRGAGSGVHTTSLHRAAVLGAAIRLGLSNMRRRGTRTTLTLITLILLTFTLLCFTSVREAVQISPRSLQPIGAQTPPPGILLRQRGWHTLPPPTLDLARELAPVDPNIPTEVAGRWWYSSEKPEQPWAIPVIAAAAPLPAPTTQAVPTTFNATALLGLDPQEADFHSNINAPLKDFTSYPPDASICWLPAKIKDLLPLNEGDFVSILGHRLQIAGFFDNPTFSTLRQLNGDPLTPIDPAGATLTSGQSNNNAASARPETAARFLTPDSIIVVPSAIVRQISGGRLTSIITRPGPSPAEIDRYANNLAQRSAFTLFVSDGQQIRSINASESARPKDLATVAVPMLLAAVIVLNTMLGAVAERTREIHVYTSVGLAPSHVGMLFLAEAAALGTIGIVFGYIAGQGLATLLSHTNLMPGVDLNYSSFSAITTMGIVLGIVMLSALWPARAATRIAAPSLKRDWKLPSPVGDLLAVDLPFTVNETAARGVCAFLEEFLITTTQSGTGYFTADHLAAILENPSRLPNREIRGLFARIWLAPYDLGVIQSMRLTIHPTDQQHVFDVHVQITREAGNPGTWHRLNRPFLTEIRKQFLLWRNLDPDQTTKYVARSEIMFSARSTEEPKDTKSENK